MSDDILGRIDATVDGLCPCGAEPAPGSAWCSEDCRPVPGAGALYLGGEGLLVSCMWAEAPGEFQEVIRRELFVRYTNVHVQLVMSDVSIDAGL